MTTLPTAIENDLELDILEHIHASAGGVRQRDLATIVGRSLGMTNAILHRLTEKGLLMVSKVNNRNISYVVTPHGMRELAGRSYRYFKRTIKNVVDYKDAIEAELCVHLQTLAARLPSDQPRALVLIGKSDLDFILEHFAGKYHLDWSPLPLEASFIARDNMEGWVQARWLQFLSPDPGCIYVWSENFDFADIPSLFIPCISLRAIVGHVR